jgi:hypothetical protein
MDLYRWTASVVSQQIRTCWRAAFERLAEGRPGVDLIQFLHAVSTLDASWIDAVRAVLRAAWGELIGTGSADTLSVTPADLASLVQRLRATAEWSLEPGLAERTHSPDLLLAATSFEAIELGAYRVVVGETHPGVHTLSQPVAQPFCPWPDEILREVDYLLAAGTMVLGDPPQTYQRSNINWLACDNLFEIVPPGAFSRVCSERRVPIGRCEVVLDAAQLFVRDRLTGRRTEVMAALPGTLHRALFALAADVVGAGHTQRIVCGNVVLKRRRCMRVSVSGWRTSDQDVQQTLNALARCLERTA